MQQINSKKVLKVGGDRDLDLSQLFFDERKAVTELLHKYPCLFAKTVKDLEGCNTL